jgi:hypothetical protein
MRTVFSGLQSYGNFEEALTVRGFMLLLLFAPHAP